MRIRIIFNIHPYITIYIIDGYMYIYIRILYVYVYMLLNMYVLLSMDTYICIYI